MKPSASKRPTPGDVIRALLARTGVPGDEIEDVVWGCAFPEGEQGINISRVAGMLAGLPPTVGGVTVALGHPLGATGGRLVGKVAQLLKRQQGRYGLATQCIGGGMGVAMIIEAA